MRIMGLRTFTGSDAMQWKVWEVRAGNAGSLLGMPQHWLTFQNDTDTVRRRLLEFPEHWEKLPPEGLDMLRQLAEPVVLYSHRFSPAEGMEQVTLRLTDPSE